MCAGRLCSFFGQKGSWYLAKRSFKTVPSCQGSISKQFNLLVFWSEGKAWQPCFSHLSSLMCLNIPSWSFYIFCCCCYALCTFYFLLDLVHSYSSVLFYVTFVFVHSLFPFSVNWFSQALCFLWHLIFHPVLLQSSLLKHT